MKKINLIIFVFLISLIMFIPAEVLGAKVESDFKFTQNIKNSNYEKVYSDKLYYLKFYFEDHLFNLKENESIRIYKSEDVVRKDNKTIITGEPVGISYNINDYKEALKVLLESDLSKYDYEKLAIYYFNKDFTSVKYHYVSSTDTFIPIIFNKEIEIYTEEEYNIIEPFSNKNRYLDDKNIRKSILGVDFNVKDEENKYLFNLDLNLLIDKDFKPELIDNTKLKFKSDNINAEYGYKNNFKSQTTFNNRDYKGLMVNYKPQNTNFILDLDYYKKNNISNSLFSKSYNFDEEGNLKEAKKEEDIIIYGFQKPLEYKGFKLYITNLNKYNLDNEKPINYKENINNIYLSKNIDKLKIYFDYSSSTSYDSKKENNHISTSSITGKFYEGGINYKDSYKFSYNRADKGFTPFYQDIETYEYNTEKDKIFKQIKPGQNAFNLQIKEEINQLKTELNLIRKNYKNDDYNFIFYNLNSPLFSGYSFTSNGEIKETSNSKYNDEYNYNLNLKI